jgi:hypothetical protein
MFLEDTSTMYLATLNSPLPFCTSNKAEVLKNKHVHRNWKKLFGQGRRGQMNLWFLERGDFLLYFSHINYLQFGSVLEVMVQGSWNLKDLHTFFSHFGLYL